MFNRANKMTALLVAAAAVVSLVPATGVNAADVKRIESKDATIYSAQAYKDGSFVIDGDVEKEDTDAIYYLKDGKYNELEDVDSGDDFNGVTSGKYLNINEGDYFIDLSNGKVTDDDIKGDDADDAASSLRKNIKKDNDGRYIKSAASNMGAEDLKTLDNAQIEGNKFGDTWYEAQYTSKDGKSTYAVYTDAKGKYIDADYNVGKIKVETTSGSGATATIKNTGDEDFAGDEDLTTSIVTSNVIGQDSNNIYRTATIKMVSKDHAFSEVNGCKVTKPQFTLSTDGKTVEFDVIQKISKAQASDDIDGAKYAKTVTTYILTNKDGDKKESIEVSSPNYTVVNGKVIAYNNKAVQTIELSSKSSNYYTDIKDLNDDDTTAFDVDVDGNLWMLDGGFIYKWDNDEDWDKVYKVDGSMSKLSVYNKDNMIAWDEEDEVYSIIGQKDKEEEKPEVEVKAGWNQAADGTWTFVKDGVKATGWLQDGANWYLLNEAGIMQTGWQTVGGTWYYLAGNGAMQTGWQNLGGNWYFLQPSGAMVTGWYNDNGTWYFCDGSGKMLANTTVNGYVLGANGAWVK